jgi:hypothetical protein
MNENIIRLNLYIIINPFKSQKDITTDYSGILVVLIIISLFELSIKTNMFLIFYPSLYLFEFIYNKIEIRFYKR